MKRCFGAALIVCLLACYAAVAATSTAKVAVTSADWTDLGAGPVAIMPDAPILYSIADSKPSATAGGFRLGPYVTVTVSTTSHVWAEAQSSQLGANVFVAPVTAKGFSLPGSVLAAYSTRKIVKDYAGAAINVRRASDNATLDIGFVGRNFDAVGAATFCANTLCFVTKWYDQAGAHDAAQAITDWQPILLILGGKGLISFCTTTSTNVGACLHTATPVAANADQTVGLASWVGGQTSHLIPLADFDSTNTGWFIAANKKTARQAAYYSSGKSDWTSSTSKNVPGTSPARLAAQRASGTATVYLNGASVASEAGHSNAAPATSLTIGGYNGDAPTFQGIIAEAFVYSSSIPSTDLSAIDANEASYWGDWGFSTPYSGAAQIQGSEAENITLGNVLNYEFTQPWTVFAAIQLFGINAGGAPQIIFSNVPGSGTAYPGYELWIDVAGRLRVRLIHDYSGSQFLDAAGSTNVIDGKKHFVAASYDGLGAAAGVKLYVDGAPETPTTILDTLGGLSIIGAGQSMIVGNQQNAPDALHGTLGHFQIDNVVRSPSYIAAHATPASLPAIDANTALSLPMTDGSGATVADASGHGLTGTLTSANMWVP